MTLALTIIAATIAAMLAMYAAARVLLGREQEDRTRDLANSVLFRISALHGLVLALVFASEVVEYNQLGFETSTEVNAISDVYCDVQPLRRARGARTRTVPDPVAGIRRLTAARPSCRAWPFSLSQRGADR